MALPQFELIALASLGQREGPRRQAENQLCQWRAAAAAGQVDVLQALLQEIERPSPLVVRLHAALALRRARPPKEASLALPYLRRLAEVALRCRSDDSLTALALNLEEAWASAFTTLWRRGCDAGQTSIEDLEAMWLKEHLAQLSWQSVQESARVWLLTASVVELAQEPVSRPALTQRLLPALIARLLDLLEQAAPAAPASPLPPQQLLGATALLSAFVKLLPTTSPDPSEDRDFGTEDAMTESGCSSLSALPWKCIILHTVGGSDEASALERNFACFSARSLAVVAKLATIFVSGGLLQGAQSCEAAIVGLAHLSVSVSCRMPAAPVLAALAGLLRRELQRHEAQSGHGQHGQALADLCGAAAAVAPLVEPRSFWMSAVQDGQGQGNVQQEACWSLHDIDALAEVPVQICRGSLGPLLEEGRLHEALEKALLLWSTWAKSIEAGAGVASLQQPSLPPLRQRGLAVFEAFAAAYASTRTKADAWAQSTGEADDLEEPYDCDGVDAWRSGRTAKCAVHAAHIGRSFGAQPALQALAAALLQGTEALRRCSGSGGEVPDALWDELCLLLPLASSVAFGPDVAPQAQHGGSIAAILPQNAAPRWMLDAASVPHQAPWPSDEAHQQDLLRVASAALQLLQQHRGIIQSASALSLAAALRFAGRIAGAVEASPPSSLFASQLLAGSSNALPEAAATTVEVLRMRSGDRALELACFVSLTRCLRLLPCTSELRSEIVAGLMFMASRGASSTNSAAGSILEGLGCSLGCMAQECRTCRQRCQMVCFPTAAASITLPLTHFLDSWRLCQRSEVGNGSSNAENSNNNSNNGACSQPNRSTSLSSHLAEKPAEAIALALRLRCSRGLFRSVCISNSEDDLRWKAEASRRICEVLSQSEGDRLPLVTTLLEVAVGPKAHLLPWRPVRREVLRWTTSYMNLVRVLMETYASGASPPSSSIPKSITVMLSSADLIGSHLDFLTTVVAQSVRSSMSTSLGEASQELKAFLELGRSLASFVAARAPGQSLEGARFSQLLKLLHALNEAAKSSPERGGSQVDAGTLCVRLAAGRPKLQKLLLESIEGACGQEAALPLKAQDLKSAPASVVNSLLTFLDVVSSEVGAELSSESRSSATNSIVGLALLAGGSLAGEALGQWFASWLWKQLLSPAGTMNSNEQSSSGGGIERGMSRTLTSTSASAPSQAKALEIVLSQLSQSSLGLIAGCAPSAAHVAGSSPQFEASLRKLLDMATQSLHVRTAKGEGCRAAVAAAQYQEALAEVKGQLGLASALQDDWI